MEDKVLFKRCQFVWIRGHNNSCVLATPLLWISSIWKLSPIFFLVGFYGKFGLPLNFFILGVNIFYTRGLHCLPLFGWQSHVLIFSWIFLLWSCQINLFSINMAQPGIKEFIKKDIWKEFGTDRYIDTCRWIEKTRCSWTWEK